MSDEIEGCSIELDSVLSSLNEEEVSQFRKIVGADDFDAMMIAARLGDDNETHLALLNFARHIDERGEEDAAGAADMLAEVSDLLGDERTNAFAGLIPEPPRDGS